ncbi:sugar kinase [Fulvitalea axinellae]
MGKVVTFGEIMLRLATPHKQRVAQTSSFDAHYGGSEANVAVALAGYGFDVSYVSRVPDNALGKAVDMELRKYGVNTRDLVFGGDRLGIYFLEPGVGCRPSQVIYDRDASAFATLEQGQIDWDKAFDGAEWFHFTGISPAVSEEACATTFEAVKAAKERGLKISMDLNYRAKLWNWGKSAEEIMPQLVEYCDVVLGNEEHVRTILGVEVDRQEGETQQEYYKNICDAMAKRFPANKQIVLTIRRGDSASHNYVSGVLWDEGTYVVAPEYSVSDIVDRVGGGDSTMGGLIAGLIKFDDPQKAINFAVASGALKHTVHGDFNIATFEEVEGLMNGQNPGRVSR